jgi:hypothetical protein
VGVYSSLLFRKTPIIKVLHRESHIAAEFESEPVFPEDQNSWLQCFHCCLRIARGKAMKPIFETCEPRPEVLKGELRDDIFAARLGDVIESRAEDVYGKPSIFF